MPVGQRPWNILANLTVRHSGQITCGLPGLRPLTTSDDGDDITLLVGLKPSHSRKYGGKHGASLKLGHAKVIGNPLRAPALHDALKESRNSPGAELEEREMPDTLVMQNKAVKRNAETTSRGNATRERPADGPPGHTGVLESLLGAVETRDDDGDGGPLFPDGRGKVEERGDTELKSGIHFFDARHL